MGAVSAMTSDPTGYRLGGRNAEVTSRTGAPRPRSRRAIASTVARGVSTVTRSRRARRLRRSVAARRPGAERAREQQGRARLAARHDEHAVGQVAERGLERALRAAVEAVGVQHESIASAAVSACGQAACQRR